MIRCTVIWSPDADGRLAQAWIDAPDRDAVTAAAHAIDAQLAVDPQTKGAEVREGLRSLSVPPLRVLFSVDEGDRKVHVLGVRLEQPPPPQANGSANQAG